MDWIGCGVNTPKTLESARALYAWLGQCNCPPRQNLPSLTATDLLDLGNQRYMMSSSI